MSQNTISPKRASSDPMRYCRTVSPAENSEPTTVPASTSSSPKWNATSMRFFEKREAIAHTSTAAKSAA